jgi:hypothetical protein
MVSDIFSTARGNGLCVLGLQPLAVRAKLMVHSVI